MPKEIYYSLKEVSEMLKVSYITVYRWIQSNRLLALKAGKQYRVRKDELDKFLQIYKRTT